MFNSFFVHSFILLFVSFRFVSCRVVSFFSSFFGSFRPFCSTGRSCFRSWIHFIYWFVRFIHFVRYFVALRCAALHSIPFRSIPRRSDRSFVHLCLSSIRSVRSVTHSLKNSVRFVPLRVVLCQLVACRVFISFRFISVIYDVFHGCSSCSRETDGSHVWCVCEHQLVEHQPWA